MTVDLAGRRTGPISHINVTPMADVMIVLLIIFMVTVPALTREVDLPDAAHARDHRNGGIAVTVRADGSIVLGGEGTIDATELANRLRTRLGHEARVVHIHADERLAYARVEAVMEACRAAGAAEVAFVAENRIGD